jgi:hypothetical protein
LDTLFVKFASLPKPAIIPVTSRKNEKDKIEFATFDQTIGGTTEKISSKVTNEQTVS